MPTIVVLLVNMVFKPEIFGVFIALACFCISLSGHLDKGPNIINENIKTILEQGKTRDIKGSCQMFIKSFDFIYMNNFKYPLVSYVFWVWIFIYWGFVLYFETGLHLLDGYGYFNTVNILDMSSMFATMVFILFIIPIIGFHGSMPRYNYLFDDLLLIIKKEKKLTDSSYGENKVRHIPVVNHFYDSILWLKHARNTINDTSGENYNSRSSILKGLFMSTFMAMAAAVSMVLMTTFVILMPKEQILATSIYPDIGLFHMGYLEIFGVLSILCIFTFIIIFIPSIYTYIFLYIMEKYKLVSRISPLIVILSSIVAIFIFSLLKPDLITPFITNRQRFNAEFVPLILLNIITDSFSILETRYMLSKAVSGSSTKLILYLVLDFLLSSLIYLSIPILTGDLSLFLDAIFFNGEMAWVGIFYWSSLFTSLFLYIYIISFIILTILYKFSTIKYLAEKPTYSLGWITAIILVIIYPLYIWSKIIISHIIPIITLLLLVFLVTKVIRKANTE